MRCSSSLHATWWCTPCLAVRQAMQACTVSSGVQAARWAPERRVCAGVVMPDVLPGSLPCCSRIAGSWGGLGRVGNLPARLLLLAGWGKAPSGLCRDNLPAALPSNGAGLPVPV